jgi:hypothetical protein
VYAIFPRGTFASWLAKHDALISKWRKAIASEEKARKLLDANRPDNASRLAAHAECSAALDVIMTILEDALCEDAIWSSAKDWREGWKRFDRDAGMYLSLTSLSIAQGVVVGSYKALTKKGWVTKRRHGWRQLYPPRGRMANGKQDRDEGNV